MVHKSLCLTRYNREKDNTAIIKQKLRNKDTQGKGLSLFTQKYGHVSFDLSMEGVDYQHTLGAI